MSTSTLLDAAGSVGGAAGRVRSVLAGSLVEQTRRCGKAGCRCAEGEPHGPYAYFAPKTGGSGAGAVRVGGAGRGGARAADARRAGRAGVVAEISAINAELLARRELR